jgi:hypothetical protein
MGSKAPPVPKDQVSDKIRGEHASAHLAAEMARDPSRDQSGINLAQVGRYGNARQNLTPNHKTQDR